MAGGTARRLRRGQTITYLLEQKTQRRKSTPAGEVAACASQQPARSLSGGGEEIASGRDDVVGDAHGQGSGCTCGSALARGYGWACARARGGAEAGRRHLSVRSIKQRRGRGSIVTLMVGLSWTGSRQRVEEIDRA